MTRQRPSTGWDARDPKGHKTFVEEVDTGRFLKYRWGCSCRRSGQPVAGRWYAAELGEKHEKRFNAKGPRR